MEQAIRGTTPNKLTTKPGAPPPGGRRGRSGENRPPQQRVPRACATPATEEEQALHARRAFRAAKPVADVDEAVGERLSTVPSAAMGKVALQESDQLTGEPLRTSPGRMVRHERGRPEKSPHRDVDNGLVLNPVHWLAAPALKEAADRRIADCR